MAAASVTIKAIDATAVHRIQSGQVIVNLCSVAKELVENSLDAGATSIEVRFKNQGLDAVEVQDNGSGIAPHNYASLALKHYTSKLATYDDLDTLQTFGFRGEALSSLCALSRFAVTTCLASDVPRGARLEFETSGRLGPGGPSVVAAQKGTTVSVENLFWNLPVRRRELERNIKREWAKVISLLNQYACIQTGVKFTVSQQPTKGKKVVLFATKGNAATRDNIINVFGAKTTGALLALDLTLEMAAAAASRWKTAAPGAAASEIRVRGYVSRPAHGQGRQTPDRQMFYVNGRPCKLPQFAQLFGEVYRSYNSSQSPFIFADIQLDTHLYDVNVSPDKQTILLHDQGRMLDTLRESLIELFEKQDITVPIGQLTSQKLTAFKKAPTPAAAAAAASRTSSATPAPSDVAVGAGGAKRTPAAAAESSEEEEDEEERSEEAPQASVVSGSTLPNAVYTEAGYNGVVEEAAEERASSESASGDEHNASSTLPPSQQHSSQAHTANMVIYPGPRKRLSHEVATVTVGGETVSTRVLSSSKRQKVAGSGVSSTAAGRPMSTETSLQRKKKTKAPLPSFGGRLTQMFSAARSSRDEDNEDNEDDEDNDDDDDDDEVGDDIYSASSDNDGASEQKEEGSSQEEEQENQVDEADEEEEEIEEDLDQDVAGDVSEEDEAGAESDDDQRQSSSPMEGVTQDEEALDDQVLPMEEDEEGSDLKEEDEEEGDEEEEEEEADEEEMGQGGDDRQPITATDSGVTDEDRRSRLFLKAGGSKKRHETLQLVQVLKLDEALVQKEAAAWHATCAQNKDAMKDADDDDDGRPATSGGGLDDTEAVAAAEEKLALTIVKSDFAAMRVVGQFNLGFILAVREAPPEAAEKGQGRGGDDELFIIDQHASDEKYNFERLQASTVVQSQRLVQPKRLELTAVEEEIVLENLPALAANGFAVDAELDGSRAVGSRCQLRTLPLSRETTFDLADLEELIALLGDAVGHHDHHDHHDHHGGAAGHLTAVPRPAKVRKMFAMRACRSSIMIGKALSRRQMASVLAHMGEMDKPWNCPHGRPTMRHLCSLGAAWDGGRTWEEGDLGDDDRAGGGGGGGQTISDADWARFLKRRRRAAKA